MSISASAAFDVSDLRPNAGGFRPASVVDSDATLVFGDSDDDGDGGMQDVPVFTAAPPAGSKATLTGPVFPPVSRTAIQAAMDELRGNTTTTLEPDAASRFRSSPSLQAFATHMKQGADAAAAAASDTKMSDDEALALLANFDTENTNAVVPPPLPRPVCPPAPRKNASFHAARDKPHPIKLADVIAKALNEPLEPKAEPTNPRARRLFRKYERATFENLQMRIHFHEVRAVAEEPRFTELPAAEVKLGICSHCDQGPQPLGLCCQLCQTPICGPACEGTTACAHCSRTAGCVERPYTQSQCDGCSRFFCGVEHRLVSCVHDVLANWCQDCVRGGKVTTPCPCVTEVLELCHHRQVWAAASQMVSCDACGLRCIDPVHNNASGLTLHCEEPGCRRLASCPSSAGHTCRVCARGLCSMHRRLVPEAGRDLCSFCTKDALENYDQHKRSQLVTRLADAKRFRVEIHRLQDQVREADATVRAVLPLSVDPESGGAAAAADGEAVAFDRGLLVAVVRGMQERFDAQQASLRAMGHLAEAAEEALRCYARQVEPGGGGAGRDLTPDAPARRA